MKHRLLLLPLLFLSCTAAADESTLRALTASAGQWEGELYYLDYQSGQRFGIPMKADVTTTPDGATLIRNLTWTDPGNLVHAVNLVTVDRNSGELVEAFFRDGQGEFMRYEIESVEFISETDWTIVYEHNGSDDNRPARIRHTTKRDGDRMISSKSVRFLDDDSAEFFERNGADLTLSRKNTNRFLK